jgi:hypothetical protein
MTSLVFDTYTYVKKLTDAGMPEAQASIIAHEQASLIEERLATKNDLLALEKTTKQELEHLELRLKADNAATKAEMIKWVAGLLIAQAGIIVTLLKLFTGT